MARIPTVEIVVNGRRKIVNADDPRAAGGQHGEETLRQEGRAQEVTRADVARMKRGDVLDLLAAHGITEAGVKGKKLPDLRQRLARIMFLEA